MMAGPKISIVIPTRNRRRLLEETLNSVFAQTVAEWELIVIDDASEDETWPWLSSLADTRIRKFRLEQHGERSTARNMGLEAARGEFVLFLDDDDLLPGAALQIHLAVLSKYPKAVASIGGYTMFNERDQHYTVRIIRRRQARHIWQELLFGWMAVSGQCLFRTEAVRAAKGWDGEFIPIEDHQLWLRVARLGPVALLPEAVLLYRVHGGQWRPPRLWKLMNKVRQRAAKKVHGKERELAERILEAREQYRQALNCYGRGETMAALGGYFKALQLAPSLFASPLTRPLFLPPMLKCFAGGRPVFSRLRRLSRKQPRAFAAPTIIDRQGRSDLTGNVENEAREVAAESQDGEQLEGQLDAVSPQIGGQLT